jgi:hypothetical protein
MAKVITFSQSFPAYHPKAGQPTFFVQKYLSSHRETVHFNPNEPTHFYPDPQDLFALNKNIPHDLISKFIYEIDGYSDKFIPKYHTIRIGNRWKVGDKFSPRVWSSKPYNSKQIIIGEDAEVEKVFEIQMSIRGDFKEFSTNTGVVTPLKTLAENDGLELNDLLNWFNKPFSGQIICWNKNINY